MRQDLPGELWRDVVGYEGNYQVSNKGRVKSFMRRTPLIMAPVFCKAGTGYWQVRLTKDNKATTVFIHRLVMLAFCPIDNADEMEVNHKSFDTLDSSLENLEWVTPKQNTRHKLNRLDFPELGYAIKPSDNDTRFGKDLIIKGAAHHLSHLTDADVLEIRRMCAARKYGSKREAAKQFNINIRTVDQIVAGQTWRHLLPAV